MATGRPIRVEALCKTQPAARFPALPAELAAESLALRPRQPDDLPFLRELYHSTRWDEVLAAGLDRLAATLFLNQQFELQRRHFDAHYEANGRRYVVTAAERPIGRLELWNDDANPKRPDLRLVDISLLPEWRRRGLGAALVRGVQALALEEGRTVSLHVHKGSPAEALYLRLGFRRTGDAGLSWRMDWRGRRLQSR